MPKLVGQDCFGVCVDQRPVEDVYSFPSADPVGLRNTGFTPEGLIAEIRRNAHYPAAEWRELVTTKPLDPQIVTTQLLAALDEAEAFVTRMPTDKLGLLFLQGGKVSQPDPDHLAWSAC